MGLIIHSLRISTALYLERVPPFVLIGGYYNGPEMAVKPENSAVAVGIATHEVLDPVVLGCQDCHSTSDEGSRVLPA